jgi:hypothetical protein
LTYDNGMTTLETTDRPTADPFGLLPDLPAPAALPELALSPRVRRTTAQSLIVDGGWCAV